ncbi:zinc knuckle CX2CX4HX4C containing protein [Tanacetum coccineum]
MITQGKRAARGPSQTAKALPQDPEPTQVIADRYVTGIMLSVDGVLGKDQSSDCVFSLQFELWPCNESTAYKTHDALDVNVNTINLVAISCNTDGYVAVVSLLQGPMILPYLANLNLARERDDSSIGVIILTGKCAQLQSLNVSVPLASQTIDLQTLYSLQGWDTYAWAFQADQDDASVVFTNPGMEDDPTSRPIIDDIAIKKFFVPTKSKDNAVSFCLLHSRMSNTSDKGTTFGDGAAKVGKQLRSSPKVSTSSPSVSPSTIINVPRELYSIDVAATFGLLSELTNEDRIETLEALGSICNSIKLDRNNADVITCKVSYADDSINLNVDESTIPSDHIVQSVDINKSTSYAGVVGGSAKDQPNVNSNFRTLVADPVFDGVNISIPHKVVENVSTRFEHTLYGYFIGKRMAFPIVEYYARNNWTKHGLKKIMMNSKGFFFFKFDSRAGLEAVLEGGTWLICKSPIILKKWSMDTRLLKEELTCIPIWVKLHDVPIQVFEEDGISLIVTFIEADLVDVVTIGIPSLSEDDFTKETIRVEYEWRLPRCDTCKIFGHVHDYCPKKVVSPPIVATSNVVTPNAEKTNDGFQTVGKKKKRKGKSKSTNGGQFTGPSVKRNVRYEPKATTKEEEDKEDVENVYDESANLIQNIKAGGSSYFTAAAGHARDMCKQSLAVMAFAGGTEESRVEPIKEEEEKAAEVVATTETKEVHPQLPGPDDTMHERSAGKIGMYTRFFDYANYRIPFSNFFVSVLIHFRISFSQLSVFGSAKFMVPANARFNLFSGSNVSEDRAPAVSEYNAEHAAILITHASPFFRFSEKFLCWVGISRNYLLNKYTYPRFEYESREEIDLNAFIRTADPRKVKIVERTRAENEEPIFGEDVSGSAGRGQDDASIGGYSDAKTIVPVTASVAVETRSSRAKRLKKKRVVHESGDTPSATHPPKRLKGDYGNTSGFVIGASPLEEGGGHTDSVTASALCTIGPSERFVVHSDSSHYSSAKSSDAEVDSLIRSAAPVMTAATTVTTSVSAAVTTTVALTDVNKDKNVPTPSIFSVSSSFEKTYRTLSLFAGRSGSDFVAGSIREEGDVDTSFQEVYIPEWTMTKGFELNDGWSCANMIDHFTPLAFFKTICGMEHEQLFAEFNVSAARNLSLSSEVRMPAKYNILDKRKWRSLAKERNDLLQVKDKEIEELKSQLLQVRDESMEVAQLRTQVASLEVVESSFRGEVASAKEHKGLFEQERSALNLKVTSLESTIAEKDHELSDLETSSSSLRSHNQHLVDQPFKYVASANKLFLMRFACYFPISLIVIMYGLRAMLEKKKEFSDINRHLFQVVLFIFGYVGTLAVYAFYQGVKSKLGKNISIMKMFMLLLGSRAWN